jgi:hypothetical protein
MPITCNLQRPGWKPTLNENESDEDLEKLMWLL